MPLYTYYCSICDNTKDMLANISDRDSQNCRECGSKLLRGIDRPGLVWAPTRGGSGFAT